MGRYDPAGHHPSCPHFTNTIAECKRLIPLGPWLDRATKARIPIIPAVFSLPFPLRQLNDALEHIPTPELDYARTQTQRYADARTAQRQRSLIRWEDCSSATTKSHFAHGGSWVPALAQLPTLDDERLMDCALTDPQRLCVRPWIEPQRNQGYPIEFRVYWGPDGWLGTSSYYPQRPLPPDDSILWLATTARDYAQSLATTEPFPLGFSADFLATAHPIGPLVFIEGGPPHLQHWYLSAHPCCFPTGHIAGLALTLQPGADTGD